MALDEAKKARLIGWAVRSAWVVALTLAAALINRYTGVQVEVPQITVVVPATGGEPKVHVVKPE